MKNYILFLCALATLAFASSCKSPTDYDVDRWDDKDTISKPARQDLAGEWYLVGFQNAGGALDSVPYQMYKLNFETNTKVTGLVNCNTLEGKYTVANDHKIAFKNLGTTKANCGSASLDALFLSALNTTYLYDISSDNKLYLSYGNSTQPQFMVLQRKQTSNPQPSTNLLKSTAWTLESFLQAGATSREWVPLSEREYLNIMFSDSLAGGKADCHAFQVPYVSGNGSTLNTSYIPLTIYIGNTKPNCAAGSYSIKFLEALKAATHYRVDGDSLVILYKTIQNTTAQMFLAKKYNPNSGMKVKNTVISTPQFPSNLPTSGFQIVEKNLIHDTLNNSTLEITTEFSGGCGSHEFILAGYVTANSIEMYLAHDDQGDPCDAIVRHTSSFNIKKLIEEYKKITKKTSGTVDLILYPSGTLYKYDF